ncbi:hypothetical protein EVAR_64539_1 [Eumeta japonica]|uniref:Uncharacterized protein n=1 Tax=Eumeta variegata TaxID=151549 RepID=A0A4C1ZTE6_EUMVA|nr:hypothetical protein EVAR_64539_1 [Eumeta japonica]
MILSCALRAGGNSGARSFSPVMLLTLQPSFRHIGVTRLSNSPLGSSHETQENRQLYDYFSNVPTTEAFPSTIFTFQIERLREPSTRCGSGAVSLVLTAYYYGAFKQTTAPRRARPQKT